MSGISPIIINLANLFLSVPEKDEGKDSRPARSGKASAPFYPVIAQTNTSVSAAKRTAAAVPVFMNDPAATFIGRLKVKIQSAVNAKNASQQRIKDANKDKDEAIANPNTSPRGKINARKNAASTEKDNLSQIGEQDILIWMLSANIGQQKDPAIISTALNRIRGGTAASRNWGVWRNAFWPGQISLILSSEVDRDNIRATLAKILWGGRNEARQRSAFLQEKDPVKAEIMALRRILKKQLSNKTALLKATALFRLALLEKRAENTQAYAVEFNKAKTLIDTVLNIHHGINDPAASKRRKAKLAKLLRSYIPELTLQSQDRSEFDKYIPRLYFLKAKVAMHEAQTAADPEAALKILKGALPYFSKLSKLDGIEALEARQLYAENVLRQGYILRERGKEYAREIMAGREQLDYIAKWSAQYANEINRTKGTVARWPRGIQAFSDISRASLIMIFAGEIRQKTSPVVIDLLAEELGADNARNLRSPGGVTADRALNIQASLLRKARAILDAIQNNPGALAPETLAGVSLNLAENLALEAFIQRSLGRALPAFNIQNAHRLLAPLSRDQQDKHIEASANLWLAKIRFVEAGDAKTSQDRRALLLGAQAYILRALDSKTLKGKGLSSALQTYGEILFQLKNFALAKKQLENALKEDPKNLEAAAALADILSQEAQHPAAAAKYRSLLNTRLDLRGRLGLAETEMRHKEDYSPEKINTLRRVVLDILAKEPPGSYLMIRGVQSLIEAFGTRSEMQEKVILIGKTLLQLMDLASAQDGELGSALQAAVKRGLLLNAAFKAGLYLKIAEVLIWTKRFDDARKLLSSIPREIDPVINNDAELSLLKRILLAELPMREKKDVRPILHDKVLDAYLSSGSNPDLAMRIIQGRLEAYFIKNDFGGAGALANRYLDPADNAHISRIKGLLKGRERSFNQFKFELLFARANSLFWGKRYKEAMEAYGKALKHLDDVKRGSPELDSKYRPRVLLSQGEIEFIRENYAAALGYYEKAEKLLKGMCSEQAVLDRARALIGMADIRRFAPGLKDLAESVLLYAKAARALKSLSPANPERAELKKRLRLGRLEADIILGEASAVKSSFQFMCGSDGRCESQLNLGTALSMGLLTPKMSWLSILFNAQSDFAQQARLLTGYLGTRLNYQNKVSMDAQFKLGTAGSGEKIVFYRRPDLKLNFFTNFGTESVSLVGAANIDYKDPRLNTYHASLAGNLGFLKSRWLKGLGIRFEHNTFNFNYLGSFQLRHSIGIGPQWKVDLIPSSPGTLEFNANLLGLAFWQRDDNDRWQQGGGLDLNIQTRFNLKKIFNDYPVFLDIKYFHQYSPLYRIHQGTVGIEIPF